MIYEFEPEGLSLLKLHETLETLTEECVYPLCALRGLPHTVVPTTEKKKRKHAESLRVLSLRKRNSWLQ